MSASKREKGLIYSLRNKSVPFSAIMRQEPSTAEGYKASAPTPV